MRLAQGLYLHQLHRDEYRFAKQAGCTDVVIHLIDYFKQGEGNAQGNQPTGGLAGWGLAGDPDKLWSVGDLTAIRREIEDEGLRIAAIENIDPAHWHDVLLDGPLKQKHLENVKTLIRNMGEVDILRILRILKENDFDGVIIPDHTPKMTCDAPWHAGMAFALGYIAACLKQL